METASVVYQRVDAPNFATTAARSAPGSRLSIDTSVGTISVVAPSASMTGHCLQRFTSARSRHPTSVFRGQLAYQLGANAVGGAGNHDGLVGE